MPINLIYRNIRDRKKRRSTKKEILLFDINATEDSNECINLIYLKDCMMWIIHILGNVLNFQGKIYNDF